MNDPWADDPYSPNDEPADDPWATNEPWAHGEDEIDSTDDKKENTVTEEDRFTTAEGTEISVTLKQHGGFDSPWLVLRAKNAADAKKALQEIVNSELTKATAWAAGEFAKTKPGNSAPTPAPQRPQAANPAPQGGGSNDGDGRSCQHGQMVYRTGTNKFGKPYEAYFCGTPKGTEGQCKAQFV